MDPKLLHPLTALLAVLAAGLVPAAEPPVPLTITEAIAQEIRLKEFAEAIEVSDVAAQLDDQSNFTVFAPTDAAWGKMPTDLKNALLRPENREQLRRIVESHMVRERIPPDELMALTSIERTLAGHPLSVSVEEGAVTIGEASLIGEPVRCKNGILYRIDRVLAPPDEE